MRFSRSDAIALLAVPLVVVAFKVESSAFSTICMSLAGGLIVLAMADHDDFPWNQRAAACGLVVALDLGAIGYLYRVNLLRELVAPLIAATLPSPVSGNCPVPRGAVALYLGNTVCTWGRDNR